MTTDERLDFLEAKLTLLTGALMLAVNNSLSVSTVETAHERLQASLLASSAQDAALDGLQAQCDEILGYLRAFDRM